MQEPKAESREPRAERTHLPPAFRFPLSAFRRRGVSIIEVMFAILVTVVGLFGAIAVFPAASAMARKGRVADASAAAGRHAVHDFDVRGMRRFDRWIGYGAYWSGGSQFNFVQQMNWPPGTAFCIDPRMVASTEAEATRTNNPALNAWASNFPAFPSPPPFNAGNDPRPRMFRITLANGLGAFFMRSLQADSIFSFDDDLSYERSTDDRSLPARQLYDSLGGTGPNAKRLAEGHFSWMATLVPKVELAPQIVGTRVIMTGRATDEYVLSIVVFHDRVVNVDPTLVPLTERTVTGYFAGGDGTTGGELQLLDNNENNLKLRSNDWVLLSGVYKYREYDPVNGNALGDRVTTVPTFQWYRVTDCDTETEGPVSLTNGNGNNATFQVGRYATLMGQDWKPEIVHPTHGVGWCQATIVDGVVAVFEKSVRLEY